jgi:hypothetical protein
MHYKYFPSIRSLIFLSFVLFIANGTARAQKCLTYGPAVTLTGTLTSHVFPGPPNYESIKHGDRKETAIILTLAKPVCASGDDPNGFDVSYSALRDMQLVIRNDADWKIVHRQMGKHVTVTGTLFGASTGHHRTKVLIDVSHIESK